MTGSWGYQGRKGWKTGIEVKGFKRAIPIQVIITPQSFPPFKLGGNAMESHFEEKVIPSRKR